MFYHPNNPIRYYSCFHYEVKTLKFKLVKILSKFWHKVDEKNPDSNSRFGSTIGFHILTLYPETLLNSHKLYYFFWFSRISIYKIKSSASRSCITSSFQSACLLILFLAFLCLEYKWWEQTSCLIPNPGEKAFSLSLLSLILSVGTIQT